MIASIINPVTKQHQLYKTTTLCHPVKVQPIKGSYTTKYATIINGISESQKAFRILKNDNISSLIQHQSLVFKFSYAKNTRDKLKVWFNRDLIRKELAGNYCLEEAGLNVPNLQAAYVNLNPFEKTYGIIIMDWIPESTTLREFWIDQNSKQRFNAIQQYIDDTCKLLEARIQINDYGPHNIIINSIGQLYWLDAVAFKTTLSEKAYFARFSKQINRVIQSDAQFWSPEEKAYIFASLNKYPLNL
jgi:RIO-like serine/threonine protein kinase